MCAQENKDLEFVIHLPQKNRAAKKEDYDHKNNMAAKSDNRPKKNKMTIERDANIK